LAVLLVGKPIQAVLNFILWLIFWIPGTIHAILVINEYKADKRAKEQTHIGKEKLVGVGCTFNNEGAFLLAGNHFGF